MAPLLSAFLLQRRLAAVTPFLRGDVLDLGCGGADIAARLRPDQAYVGVDWRAALIDQLRARWPRHTFYQRDFDTQPLALPRRFDTVVMLAVIEHLSQPDHLFAQLCAVLQPGGQVVMTSPSAWGNWLHGWGARVGLFSREAAREHNLIFSRDLLADRVRPHGMALAHYSTFGAGGNQLFVCRPAAGDAAQA